MTLSVNENVSGNFGGALVTQLARRAVDREFNIRRDQKIQLRCTVLESAIEVGFDREATQLYLANNLLRSRDPGMRNVGRSLLRTFKKHKRGRPENRDQNFKIACRMHAEIQKFRANGEREYDIHVRAAEIVIRDLKLNLQPRRLLEIYREQLGHVEDAWTNFDMFGKPNID